MKKFIVLHLKDSHLKRALPIQSIYKIDQEKEKIGTSIYTTVHYDGHQWIKVRESVEEVVEKIHSAQSEDLK